jgi:hypothetical protein
MAATAAAGSFALDATGKLRTGRPIGFLPRLGAAGTHNGMTFESFSSMRWKPLQAAEDSACNLVFHYGSNPALHPRSMVEKKEAQNP